MMVKRRRMGEEERSEVVGRDGLVRFLASTYRQCMLQGSS